MRYAHRIREGAVYVSSSPMQLADDDLVMEWAHALATDYRYIQLTPGKRRNYLKKRIIYDGIMEEYQKEAMAIRLALAFERYLQQKELFLEDNLLAGSYQFSDHIYTHPFDEQDELEWLLEEGGPLGIDCSPEEVEVFLNYVKCGFCTKNPSGHVIPDYPRLLSLGYGGILQKIEEQKQAQGETDFLRAAEISVKAGMAYIRRYAEAACQKAKADPEHKERWQRMSKACAWIAEKPPRSFFEAVQLIALTHELAITEQLSGSISFGRFDAYVTPYYLADLERGTLTSEEAYQIVHDFFAKIGSNRLAYQNLTLGGLNEEGNGFLPWPVTRMCLKASMELHKDEPMVTFRWNKHMPQELWEDVLASIRSGTGFPALFNDDVVIAAKENCGLSHQDALRYGMIGCVEICAPGKEFSHAEGLRINWAKMLEAALHGGKDPLTGIQFPMNAPVDLESFKDFESFYQWFMAEFTYTFKRMLRILDLSEAYYAHRWPLAFMSSLMTGCLEKGKDVTAGGTLYNNTAINHSSMANLADSLQAIRKCVFEEKTFTLSELSCMMAANFEGYDRERIQIQKMIDRYGNGHQDSEQMMNRIAVTLEELVRPLRNCRGGQYQMGYYSVWAQATFGALTGALPDGRLAKTALANSMAPVQGCEKNGPTAIAVSATALNHRTFGNGMVLDYKFSPAFFNTAAHRQAFRALVEGYFALGGMEMQFNVVDRETLLDAQIHPQDHESLIVRVSGYSAFFNDLSKEIQDEIILRTEFK